MVFSLFKKQPLLEEEVIEWLFSAFAWSLRNFGTDTFYKESILVTPSNQHFPGRENSVDSMAELILDRVKSYAGVNHWPTRLVNQHYYHSDPTAEPNIQQVLESTSELKLPLLYEPQQVGNPQAMIANYAHAIAHHLGFQAQERPPCDEEQWPHIMEVVSAYMGFGLMMANTAHPYRGGGCGRCRSPAMDRDGFLDETEVTYALAIFCVLKQIPISEVNAHLKGSLRSFFKKAMKDVVNQKEALSKLRSINQPSLLRGKAASIKN